MVSGYDKSPPEPPYEPETESGVDLILIAIIVALLFSSFGVLFSL
jgi:hypothetical protein